MGVALRHCGYSPCDGAFDGALFLPSPRFCGTPTCKFVGVAQFRDARFDALQHEPVYEVRLQRAERSGAGGRVRRRDEKSRQDHHEVRVDCRSGYRGDLHSDDRIGAGVYSCGEGESDWASPANAGCCV